MSHPQSRCAQLSSLYPQAGCRKRSEATKAMDTTLHKVDTAEEGAVGGADGGGPEYTSDGVDARSSELL